MLIICSFQRRCLATIVSVCAAHSGHSLVEVVSAERLPVLSDRSADIPHGRLDETSSGAAVSEGHSCTGLAVVALE